MQASPNTTVILDGVPYGLRWDKGALFRADEMGLFDRRKAGIGVAAAAKYVWAMGPVALRERFATPENVAEAFPEVSEMTGIWSAINAAVELSRSSDPKKNGGLTNGPSPASS